MIKKSQLLQDKPKKTDHTKYKNDLTLPSSRTQAFLDGFWSPKKQDFHDYLSGLKGNTKEKLIAAAIKSKNTNWLIKLLRHNA